MGAITRGAFTVLVLAAVMSSLFVVWYGVWHGGQVQATGGTPPAARRTLAMPHPPLSPVAAVAPASGESSAAAADEEEEGPADGFDDDALPEPEVTVTVRVTVTPSPPPPPPRPSPTPRTARVGYLAQRGAFGGTSTVMSLETSGLAARLTHVNYAFANIDPDALTCLSGVTRPPLPDPDDPDQGDGAGDAWADYLRGFSAAESVDGVADAPDTVLGGNFNQLKKLKARHPGLKTLISIGGPSYSKYFSDVAATAESRRRFVRSCLDAYIKGDLPEFGGRGGPRSAEGVFDGVDIDWEWPGSRGHAGNHVSDADRENLTELLAEFRYQLDALGEEAGRRYLLTVYLPRDRRKLADGFDLDRIYDHVDFVNTQGAGARQEGAETGLVGHPA
ncbi:glycoside hydrolase family 18 protein [Sphaerimonospora cavernae]|uniref:chitinase n=1 Tax=Sphaerimonospora cavernae TaxID=1740611 RepID=A0ABV6UCZ6_9ACTN